jgi:hypothetical protein
LLFVQKIQKFNSSKKKSPIPICWNLHKTMI